MIIINGKAAATTTTITNKYDNKEYTIDSNINYFMNKV